MYRYFVKPVLDFLFALTILPFFLIFILIPVAIAIKCDDGGPIFYCGKRLGRNGKPFRMIKFRSMTVNAPDLRLEDGSTYNGADDPRVTKVGRILRKTSLDEVPQILNILTFRMSFIGPRPDPLDWLERYADEDKIVLRVLPGITGYNQAYFRNTADGDEKLEHDKLYAKKISLFFDIRIFFKTVVTVFKKENVYVDASRTVVENEENASYVHVDTENPLLKRESLFCEEEISGLDASIDEEDNCYKKEQKGEN